MEFCILKKDLCKRGGCCGYAMHITGKKMDGGICPHATGKFRIDLGISLQDCFAKSRTTVIGKDEKGEGVAEINKGITTRLGR